MPKSRSRVRIVGIIAAGAGLVVLAVLVTIANVFARQDPDLAARVSPFAAQARAAVALRRASAAAQHDQPAAIVSAATAALIADPTASGAATALGIAYDLEGRQAAADRAIRYSGHLSKRDTVTQLWLIERAVVRGDVVEALGQYDLILRRVAALRPRLYPILSNAAAEPQVAAQLSRLLRKRANWTTEFVGQFVFQQNDPAVLDAVTRGYLNPRDPAERAILGSLLTRMVDLGRPDLALRRYWTVATGATAGAIVRDPDFADSDPLPPFGWSYAKDADAPDRGFLAVAGRSVLYLPPDPSRDIVLARQLIALPAGTYQLVWRSGRVAGDGNVRPALQIACATTRASLLNIVLPPGDQGSRGAEARFAVPANCDFAWLTIRARNVLDRSSAEPGWITGLAIRRQTS